MSYRLLAMFTALLLLVAACGTGEAATPASTAAPSDPAPAGTDAPATTAPASTEAPATTGETQPAPTTSAETAAGPSGVDGPPAPDFTLALGDGSTYQLSADTKPVYMIFWAEW